VAVGALLVDGDSEDAGLFVGAVVVGDELGVKEGCGLGASDNEGRNEGRYDGDRECTAEGDDEGSWLGD